MPYDYLAGLPTYPDALREEIYAQAQQSVDDKGDPELYPVDQEAYSLIVGIVKHYAPPALKGALYQVAATIPGVETVDDAVDAAGRRGIGVTKALQNGTNRITLIFDKTTYQLLGSHMTSGHGLDTTDALLDSGLVDGIGQKP